MTGDMVHVAFRSVETGRYLFHAKWPRQQVEKFRMAARLLGLTEEQFIHQAVEEYVVSRQRAAQS